MTSWNYILTIYTKQDKIRDAHSTNRYKTHVPGKRAFGQKLVPVPMRDEFIEHINSAVDRLNYGDRSKLIRDAIVEKLNREGIETPASLAAAPLRVGKMARGNRRPRVIGPLDKEKRR